MAIGSAYFLKESFQLELGTTSSQLEPPIQQPDHPIPINSLNNVDVVSSVGGRNLIPNTRTMGSGITINGVKNGEYEGLTIVKSVKTTTAYLDTFKTVTIGVPKEDAYTISFLAKANRNTTINNHFYSPNTTTSSLTSQGNKGTGSDGSASINITTEWKRYWITWTQTVPTTFKNIIVGRNNGEIGTEVEIAGVKFEAGSVATPYSEAPEDISYNTPTSTLYKTNILLPEPLRSVGDVKDRLFRDTDGLWKVERNVVLYTFTELSHVAKNSTSSTNYLYYTNHRDTFDIPVKPATPNVEASHLPIVSSINHINASDQSIKNGIGMQVTGLSWGFYWNLGTSVENNGTSIKRFFESEKQASRPFQILYERETPVVETLPDDLQQKLNNIQSYRDSNYVYTISDLQPMLTATFKSKGWYDKYLTETELKLVNDKADGKANQEQVDKVAEDLSNFETIVATKEELNGIITSLNDYKDMIESNEASLAQAGKEIVDLLGRVPILENNLGEFTENWSFLDTYMTAGEEGLIIGSRGGGTAIRISDDRIDFMDGAGEPVAFITNQVMQINRGIFVQSATIGEHKIETIAGGHTIWTWIPTV